MTKPAKITPMLQQYLEIKNQHQDAILFYRLGDFYEMFFDDAVTASRILGITLTSRNHKDGDHKIPLCGVPYHAAANYLAKLVKSGHRVAICEQVEDPREAKGVVKREVTKVVTPGLATEEQLLDDKSNRYVAAVVRSGAHWGLSLLDLSTGEFLVTERDDQPGLLEELARLAPSELLVAESGTPESEIRQLLDLLQPILPELCLTERSPHDFDPERAREALLDHFQTINLAGFGCERMEAGVTAAGSLLLYLRETQKAEMEHIERLIPLDLSEVLMIDDGSRRNLELCQTIIGGKREGSLLATLDFTRTPMGARLLKRNLLLPLQNIERINQRLHTVEQLFADQGLRETLRDLLAKVYDLERLNSRVVLGSANARDLTALKLSLAQLPLLRDTLAALPDGLLAEGCRNLDDLSDLRELLEESIREDAPVTLRDGNLIQAGFNPELDDLVDLLTDHKRHILALEARERERSGIANLKIGFNKVFGYYLEVSRGQLANVPDSFIRKQTLVNAERYITPELKEFEGKVLGAQEKRLALEYRLFSEIRTQAAARSPEILKAAAFVARVDFFSSLAEAARRFHYARPQIQEGEMITIREGRHPVIERALPAGRFAPNDLHLDQTDQALLIITGPNMAGKSTVLRQTALIVLMAQMGSFVPAAAAQIGVVDRIFTRVGAMDDLRKGQSTFMVEMNETANILNNATSRSLVILDEIGRGTSTFDGLSIAWAVAEDLVTKDGKGVKTLFATHYHELTELAQTHQRVKNFHIAVREWNETIIFLHKLLEGSTNRSYGIQVAALAGVPGRVTERATKLLRAIEQGEFTSKSLPQVGRRRAPVPAEGPDQLKLFGKAADPLKDKLARIEPDRLTPLEALTLVYELKALSHD